MPMIKGNKQLQAFRNYWNGERMLKLIECCNGRMRVNWQIGTGKSHNIDQVLETANTSGKYDLIIVLCPTRQILNERDWVIKPPSGVRVANLRRRPRRLCGKMDREWKIFEQNGLGILGRLKLCGQCNARRRCYWPKQYGRSLAGTQVIFATQFHLNRSPIFINQIVHWTRAKRVLGIFDEANFLLAG